MDKGLLEAIRNAAHLGLSPGEINGLLLHISSLESALSEARSGREAAEAELTEAEVTGRWMDRAVAAESRLAAVVAKVREIIAFARAQIPDPSEMTLTKWDTVLAVSHSALALAEAESKTGGSGG